MISGEHPPTTSLKQFVYANSLRNDGVPMVVGEVPVLGVESSLELLRLSQTPVACARQSPGVCEQ